MSRLDATKVDLLLEIGSEEIPAGYLTPAVARLAALLTAYLAESGVEFATDQVEQFATPRRLAVLIHGVALAQRTRTEQKLGPAVAAAFDAAGKPTAAAAGFARSAGVSIEQLKRVPSDRGERIAAEVTVGGGRTFDLLLAEGLLERLIQVGFPKTMRWVPHSSLAYARPIRWLVCLLDAEVVPMQLAHLTAGRVSRGHRTLADGPVTIARAADYERELADAQVMVRPQQRRQQILEAARHAAQQAGGRLHEDEELLDEVMYLVEHPHPVLGSYDPGMVEALPREVIITAMRAHQRYFCIESAAGALLPRFITFRDGADRSLGNVVEGNERVLRARLNDALFYWNEDRAVASDAKLERLSRIVWLEGFGSVRDKCQRTADLALSLLDELGLAVDPKLLGRAALLSKSDLGSEMIKDGKEFTKLQGVIGRYYALEASEPAPVADAILEHLYPRYAGDRLPQGDLATLVALADRLDVIAGCTLAGFSPSGGQDPYALRRQSLAVVRILVEHDWHLRLDAWTARALDGYGDRGADADSRAKAQHSMSELLWGRLETYLSDLPAEIVRAVLSVYPLDPVENVRAARALAAYRGQAGFAMLLEGAKRCRNILVKEGQLPEEALGEQERAEALQARARGAWSLWEAHAAGGPAPGFDAARLSEPAERGLHDAARGVVPQLSRALGSGDYDGIFSTLATLGGPIDRYFTEVLVNAPDPEVRRGRLGFLGALHALFARFGDLSRLVSVRT